MMPHRLAIQSISRDARAENYRQLFAQRFPKNKLSDVAVTVSYTVNAPLTKAQATTIGKELSHPTVERFSISEILAPPKFTFGFEIGFLPGVTDNVGTTARQMIEDAIGKKLSPGQAVYSSFFVFLTGKLSQAVVESMARELHNPLIEGAHVFSYQAFKRGQVPIRIPKVTLPKIVKPLRINLNVSDEELTRIGKEGIASPDGTRRGPLALSLPEMHAIRDYFKSLKRNPTDIELESLAQTWSEHCKHTIFNDPLDDIPEGLYKRYIRAATETIRRQKGSKDFCVSVFTDNSGAIAFDDEYLITHKVETHNSPSALDPFGGAITGIVGVNRDTLGFGLGAKPVANIYGFCVGAPSDTRPLFRDKNKTEALLPARRILEGVVRGINAGGNQSGIPTPLGFVYTHDSFRGKPFVFAGTVGLIPRRQGKKLLYQKSARPGNYIVVIGGRVGLDGIHGATFSSEALQSGSPATAVQIGDPITQKKLSDAIVREARNEQLYTSITDNGAGGISCSVAEMARECGGCSVNLETVPLKYPGLSPWQIWISESQERMTLAVPPGKWLKLKKLMEKYGVEATQIGTFTRTPKCIVKYHGQTIMDMDMKFLHGGRPAKQQQSQKPVPAVAKPLKPKKPRNLKKDILAVIQRPNIGSIAFISQQYDHEVQGTSVTKPMQGKGRVNSDAAVIAPVRTSQKGVVISHGYYPLYSEIDTYAMAAASIDTAIRNAVCAGGSLSSLALLDNFCWSSALAPERLYQLKEAARACYQVAIGYGTPYISGKDSMFNDFKGFTENGSPIHIAALPTLLISAIGILPNVTRALTLDLKAAGNYLYLLGTTHEELGASEYGAYLEEKKDTRYAAAAVPQTDVARNKKLYSAVSAANQKSLIASALGVSRGGLAATLAKMAIAGQLGIAIKLPNSIAPETSLFSESQGRIVVEVAPTHANQFEELMEKKHVALQNIGSVTNKPSVTFSPAISLPLATVTRAYRSAFKGF